MDKYPEQIAKEKKVSLQEEIYVTKNLINEQSYLITEIERIVNQIGYENQENDNMAKSIDNSLVYKVYNSNSNLRNNQDRLRYIRDKLAYHLDTSVEPA